MFTVFSCIAYMHDIRLVVLAGCLCFLSSLAALTLLQRARNAVKVARLIWLLMGGAAGGFGIWATHFVAMLAYDGGVVVGYDTSETLTSLALVVVATLAAVAFAAGAESRVRRAFAGMLFGVGVTSMHFLGMAAVQFPGSMTWDQSLVLASMACAVVISAIGFALLPDIKADARKLLVPAATVCVAIVAMHFTAMAALTIVPGPGPEIDPSETMSTGFMVVTLLSVSLSMIASGFAAALFAMRAESSTKESKARFEMLVQGVTDYAIYMLDKEGRVANWNAGAERAKGYTADEIIGEDFGRFYSVEDRAAGMPQQALLKARTEGKFEAEGLRFRKDGSSFWAHVVIDPIWGADGEIAGYAKITKDVTEQKADRDRIKEVSRNLDLALENVSQGICLFDAEERLVLANRRYGDIFEFEPGAIRPGMTYREIITIGYEIHFSDPETVEKRASEHYDKLMRALRSGERSIVHKGAHNRSIQLNLNMLPDSGWVATYEDITERLISEEKIAFMARHDALTGLPNRSEFSERLLQDLAVAKRAGTKVAVIGIDLDKFKEINDQRGHHAGDQVLVTLSDRMSALLGEDEFVARFGGDEFAAIKQFSDIADLHDFVARLEVSLTTEFQIDGFDINPDASIGVAIYPQDGTTGEMLLANADLAMYRAKATLSERICFYEVAMDEAARDRRKMASDLWLAIEKNELHLHFQVQKSVSTGDITGYEVLLRWQHPTRGNVPPGEFISVAEECGAIVPIGEWVLREACKEAAGWAEKHKIAVNLSPVQIGHQDIAHLVHSVLFETGLEPWRLELEITESSIIVDKDRALLTLRKVKNLGVSIAIDDFGTGYSSLETLRSFPFDKIKLDRSFMNEVETSEQAKAIIRAIVALGQSLNIPVLAEGVETDVQLGILLDEGCDEAQGYLLGRPMPMRSRKIAA
ncbi:MULTISPECIES: bifunctional diguanylate cyclase/phosphodiesterase [unclassified Rhizobium]|uniref:bifunctional diguanylate cyclase/phosphodiesterase n=1 Tax=unclassified Rhizobium TaxID=2613769 RepID=UPI001ADB99A1|nr:MULTISPECIES: EAL domain-containing protein [unclassified Rhizobium]MBO9125022.1 EAL domain-containing protein [Rhizobium sp. 16-488-2b]MBO9175607.1 EAL domain-containing protein [Rhizobium sp. 16-488-2a]